MTRPGIRSPWLPFGTAPEAPVRLLCLPHAGAGASVYRAWGAGFSDVVGVCPVQPPGREKRRGEEPFTDVGSIVTSLAPVVIEAISPPYAILGHSTGALCAFELAREIRRLGGADPAQLFVAGRRAPQLPMEVTRLSGLSGDELAVVLRRIGGTPEEVLGNHRLLEMIQPLLAADFSVNERYTYHSGPPLATPITAFAATDDLGAAGPEMAAWEQQTSARFRMHTISGGHFAVFDQAAYVQSLITGALQP